MTRIISGFAGSRELSVPRSGTRPTSDRVREAIFSALDARDLIPDARVLDLYAGSGALGLEALSRGAAHVVLVEKNAQAASAAKSNAAIVCAAGHLPADAVRTHTSSVTQFLAGSRGDSFDLVFIDPPYELGETEITECLSALAPWLTADAVVVLERSTRSGDPQVPSELVLEKTKAYGETTVHWLARAGLD